MECTGATLIKNRLHWPHEGVYTADGKPAVYGDLTLTAFVRGYLMVLGTENARIKAHMSQHLEDLMEDSDLYGWTKVWLFHSAWLNQIQQGRSFWGDTDSKVRLLRNLV